MYKALILPAAKEDIKEAAKWYNKQQKGLGLRFTTQIREKVNIILENPYAYSIRYAEIRTASVNCFPFLIHFSIDESRRILLISAVFHISRNPDIWDRNI